MVISNRLPAAVDLLALSILLRHHDTAMPKRLREGFEVETFARGPERIVIRIITECRGDTLVTHVDAPSDREIPPEWKRRL